MPRFPRIHLDNAAYFIHMEGPSGEPIYKDAEDYGKYLNILAQAKQEFGFKLFSYTLLPDRLHLLIEPQDEHPVSQIMQKITPTYTKYYNNKYGRKGHLFPKRFRSVYVERNPFLARVSRYMHLLPQRVGATSNFRDYPYSSYAAYTPAPRAASLAMSEEAGEVLALLGATIAEDPYERYVLSADDREMEFLEKKLSRGSFLGSAQFVQHVREAVAAHAAQKTQEAAPALEAPVAESISTPGPELSAARGGWNLRPVLLSGALFMTVGLSIFSVLLNHHALQFVPTAKVVEAVQEKVAPVTKMIARATPFTFKEPVEGMVWEVEIYEMTADGSTQPIKDQIRFNGKSFESYYFSSQGFSPSNYTVNVRENGAITWETMQKNPKGEVITWRGDMEGGRMEGVVNYQPSGRHAQDYAFVSHAGSTQKVHNG